ncbi:MAG: hypothetical protein ACKV19_22220 [Verrucomicrobiales bacterium]
MPIRAVIQPYLHIHQGFCHPDWEGMADVIEGQFPESSWSEAWVSAARAWLERLGEALGPSYHVHETSHFLLLTEARPSVSRDACTFCESSLQRIQKTFRGLGCDSWYGKHVVLMFGQVDDYYRYILYFYPDGNHPMSGGVCLDSRGYQHIALPTPDYASYRTALVHELTHAYLSRFTMPVWLDEALAMRMELAVCGTNNHPLDRELRDRHLAHWNPTTIQEFWSGASWRISGDSSELSYSLALLLWQTIESEINPPPEALNAFLGTAHRDNAGEESAQIYFDLGLGDLVADFLGPGEWEPRPERWNHQSETTGDTA